MFNIGILTLKSADAVKMDITSDQKSQIELKNLDLEKQFIAAKNTKEIVFDRVTMKNTAIATINPCCQSIFIEKTTCLINFLNLKGKKMGLYVGMTAIMSLLNSATVMTGPFSSRIFV
ncbi:hypothetical protein VCUG_00443 [Vavraia culicis subsp. floridensis]|uniref:Uncharacterized protein n=1 Tax=Vavraia culicis (isolate floridensis) TaxID=948595 RepID=L2GY52_VAVCU|nr:uncharacterized protein VCUG_00443 [Vavraia culicis subsp. floridensis]ELA48020.2 hypothetical protein VCUG_00443 [Vavraia culicis subsp. floridensis]